jgi:hypothetical protein
MSGNRPLVFSTGDIIRDGDGQPVYRFVSNAYWGDRMDARMVIDLRTGEHPITNSTVHPSLVAEMKRRAERLGVA